MSDHGELADQREEEAERMQRESDRVGEGADTARDKVEQTHADELIPEPLGSDDPGQRDDDGQDDEE